MNVTRRLTKILGAAGIAASVGASAQLSENDVEPRWPFVRVEEIRSIIEARQDEDRAVSARFAETVRAGTSPSQTPSNVAATSVGPTSPNQATQKVVMVANQAYVDAITRADKEKATLDAWNCLSAR